MLNHEQSVFAPQILRAIGKLKIMPIRGKGEMEVTVEVAVSALVALTVTF